METKQVENGTYIAEHRMYAGTKRRIIVFNHKATIYTLNGVFVCAINSWSIEEQYCKLVKQTKANKLYNIVWMIRGTIAQTITMNASYACVKWKINKMKQEGYDQGLLLPVESNLS